METARIFKTYKFRLHPTDDQAARLDQWCAASRWVYNAALEQRETYGRRKGTDLYDRPSIFRGCGKKTDDVIIQDSEVGWRILADDPDLAWLTDLPSMCRQITLQDLDKAFDRFFKKQGGYPTVRTRARNNSVRFQCWSGSSTSVVFGKDSVKFPRIGRIAYNRHMKPRSRFGQASITKEGNRWWIRKSENDAIYTASAFTDVHGTVSDAAGIDTLNGTATYQGGAAGKYALASSTGGTNDAGHFTADAKLEADFTANKITGTIDNFTGADGETRDWSVELKSAAVAATGAITRAGDNDTVWTIGDAAASASGSWAGDLRNNGDDLVPKVATGTFHSTYGDDGSMVGAFGANVK